jgi:hypothetical protein
MVCLTSSMVDPEQTHNSRFLPRIIDVESIGVATRGFPSFVGSFA